MILAPEYLLKADTVLRERGADRDCEQERSMRRIVATFNSVCDRHLSEREGWLFMCCLKMVRAASTPTGKVDDYVDLINYAALAGESSGAKEE